MICDATRCAEMAGLPNALDVEHFAQARIQELEFLDTAVAAISADVGGAGSGGIGSSNLRGNVGARLSAAGGLHDQSQAIPRHMRRRTTSHKPRRMPVALKNTRGTNPTSSTINGLQHRRHGEVGASDQTQGKDPKQAPPEARRCRKHRRRPRALLEMHSPHALDIERDGDGEDVEKRARGAIIPPRCRWLETHIWHAKRMHMKEKWGFMLPIESNRGPRAAAEAALKHCTVQDVTFMRPLELRGPRQCILGALSVLTDPIDSRPTHQDCVDGLVEAHTHLYRVSEFPLGCIAPVSLLWGPSDASSADTSVKTRIPHESGGGGTQKVGGGEQHERNEDEGQEEKDVIHEEEQNEEEGEDGLGDIRRLWVWVHPAAAKEALRQIRTACELDGSPWQGTVQAGPLSGGLCRLRVRGARSHETVQRVLRTSLAPSKSASDTAAAAAAAAAGGVPAGFEDAARDNAEHWQALAPSPVKLGGGSGNGSGGPRLLPSGSVLALTALDPRELKQYRQNRVGAGGAGSGRKQAPVESESGTSKDAAASAGAGAAVVEQWPPRWAAISPLWDPDARSLSAELAATRPDHVINESRRRQRAREAWDNGDGVAAAAAASIHGSRSDAFLPEGASGDYRGGATPVILVSASGTTTLAHGAALTAAPTVSAADIFRGDRRGNEGGKSGGAAGKAVERKRRAVAAGWDIILPPGWAPVFFGALVMAGARALSLKDADDLRLESGEPCFPVDFPDTASGRRHWDQIGQEAEAVWTRTRPKHRGFKRRPQPPPAPFPRPTPPLALSAGADEPEGVIAGESAIGGGGGAGGAGGEARMKAGAESNREGQGGLQQDDPVKAPTPSSLSPSAVSASSFRPDFGSLAAGGVPIRTGERAVTEARRSSHPGNSGEARDIDGEEGPAGSAGSEVAVAETSRCCEGVDREGVRDVFAVARGFQYSRAFLPEQDEGAGGSAAHVGIDTSSGDGERIDTTLAMPPPLCLAFPTVLELVIVQDKGVPEAGALIRAASPDHHALWIQGRQDGRLWPGLSSSAKSSSSSLSSTLAAVPAGADVSAAGAARGGSDDPAAAATAKTAIGAVTSGGFSFLRGGGVGRALCEAVAVRDAFWVSLSCSRRQRGGDAAGEDQHRQQQQQGRPWALVLVGNEAGSWLRPAVAFVADS